MIMDICTNILPQEEGSNQKDKCVPGKTNVYKKSESNYYNYRNMNCQYPLQCEPFNITSPVSEWDVQYNDDNTEN